jgi:hypothetical protein
MDEESLSEIEPGEEVEPVINSWEIRNTHMRV